MTNGDKIRQMTDEELERCFRYRLHACCRPEEFCGGRPSCERCWREWLQEEVQEDG